MELRQPLVRHKDMIFICFCVVFIVDEALMLLKMIDDGFLKKHNGFEVFPF